jgi:hypothetical protein
MAEIVETIQVRLKYSKTGGVANINAADFDPEKHARMDEPAPSTPPPSAPPSPPVTPAPTTEGTAGEGEPSGSGRRRP